MAVIGTFGSFTAARLGIYASQATLNVTGNNIANINTKGYTRQRMDLVSLHSAGSARYHNSFNLDIGYGVLTESVSQLRDPFLDIRYRDEAANVGAYEEKLKLLQQLSHTLDEVGDGEEDFGILEAQFNNFLAELQNYNGKIGSMEYDTTVRSSAEVITQLFNSYAEQFQKLENSQLKNLKGDVETVNTLLTRIRDLSAEIREAGIHNDKALELRDARNVCIDELSEYMKIDVSYDLEKIDEFKSVERINISIADSGNPPIKLIQGIYGAQITMPEKTLARNPGYDPKDITGMKYISRESNYNVNPPQIFYTDIAREAYREADGKTLRENPLYSPTAIAGHKYVQAVDADGKIIATTDDPALALEVDNAVEGSEENRLWMQVEPLVDYKGRYMRDQYHQEVKETVDLNDTVLYGSLQSMREFLTEEGEFASQYDTQFDPNATIKRGVKYYRKSLDALAKRFADLFNEANQLDLDTVQDAYKMDAAGTNFVKVEADGTTLTPLTFDKVKDDGTVTTVAINKQLFDDAVQAKEKLADTENPPTDAEKKELLEKIEDAYAALDVLRQEGTLTERWSFYNGGVMFSNSGKNDDPTGINAANISIANSWANGEVRILFSKKPDILDHSSADDNVAHMINMMKSKYDYYGKDIVDDAATTKRYFNGTFQERLSDMNIILAKEQQTTLTLYDSYTTKALALENNRQSVSGVDLNDEAMSMMQYQKSYAAACQLLTTLDSMLDKLINGTI